MRPFVFINSAMSADGKIATIERKQKKISGKLDFDRVDELKASSDAVMVGIGTVLSDNPSLTVKSDLRKKNRLLSGLPENPTRIIIDSMAKTPIDSDIFKKGDGKRIIAVSENAPNERKEKLSQYAQIITVGKTQVELETLMFELKKSGINKIMVEGGATLNWGLISKGLVDEIYTYVGNIIIGGKTSPTLVDGEGHKNEICKMELISVEKLEDGILIRWKIVDFKAC